LNASLEIPIFKQSLNSVLCQREEKRRVVKLGMVSSRKIPRPLAIFLTRGGKWDVMFFLGIDVEQFRCILRSALSATSYLHFFQYFFTF